MDVYKDQVAMIEALQSLIEKLDVLVNGGDKPTGLIAKQDLIKTLKNFYPVKTQGITSRAPCRVQ
jgi:hypothetical protein